MHDELDLTMPSPVQVQQAADSFRMLSDPTRLKILWALLQGESNVGCLAELVEASPTTVSQHLAKLRLAGLVQTRREGTFIYYSAANHHVQRLLSEGLWHAEHATGSGHAGSAPTGDRAAAGERAPADNGRTAVASREPAQ